MSPVLVLAAGNDARGDDALGPTLLARIEAQGWAHVRTVFDFQFQIEHALEFDGADLVLFIDAHARQTEPVVLSELRQAQAAVAGSHALSPAQVLGVHAQISAAPPPPIFVLSVAGEQFELGAAMSGRAQAALARAEALAFELLRHPDVPLWRRAAGGTRSSAADAAG